MTAVAGARNEKMAHSAIISFLGSGFAAAAAMVLTILVGRWLGAEGTGLFYLAVGIFTIASQILRLGSNSGVIRTIATQRALENPGHATTILRIAAMPVLAIALAAATIIMFAADTIAGFLVAPADLDDFSILLQQLAFLIALSALLTVLHTFTRMLNSVLVFTLLQNVLLPAGRVLLVGLALWWGAGAFEAVLAWAASIPFWVLITLGILLPKLRQDKKAKRQALAPGTARAFWNFSAARGAGGALEICLEWADVLLVAALRTPAEAGIYAVVTRIVRAGQIIDRAMRVAVSPRIAELMALKDRPGVRQLHTKATQAMIIVGWPFYLTLVFFGEPVLLFFGPEFTAGTPVLSVAALGIMILTSAGMLQSLILMGGRSSWQMLVKSMSLGLSIVLNILLVPVWGIMGAAVTWTIVIVVETAVCGILVYRRMRVGLDFACIARTAVVPLLVFGPGWAAVHLVVGVSLASLLIGMALLLLAYLLAILMLRKWLGLSGIKLGALGKRF